MDFDTLRKISLSQVSAAKRGDATAVAKWALRALLHVNPAALESDVPEQDSEFLVDFPDDGIVYLYGGSPANPNGVSFTLGQAKAWWTRVFADGLNISLVRPTLLPGSLVLSSEGLAKARALGVKSTDYAPEDFNPLGLEIVP